MQGDPNLADMRQLHKKTEKSIIRMSKQLERDEYPDNFEEKATESAFNDLMSHR